MSTSKLGAALLDATEAGDEAKVRALLDAGAPVLTEDNGWTMLHLACQQGLGSAVRWALEAGIEPGSALPNGFTPLHIAIESAQNRPLNYTVTLTRNGEQVTLTEPDAIRAAIGSHPDDEYATKIGIATLLLERGADVDALTTDGQSPANHAAARGVDDVLRQLIERGADLDVRDRFGLTALHMACRNGHSGSVSLLLAAGADVSVGDEYGFTALHEAAENGRLDVIPLLLAGGADRSRGNHKPYRTIVAGTTPAQLAIAKNKADAAQLLTS